MFAIFDKPIWKWVYSAHAVKWGVCYQDCTSLTEIPPLMVQRQLPSTFSGISERIPRLEEGNSNVRVRSPNISEDMTHQRRNHDAKAYATTNNAARTSHLMLNILKFLNLHLEG